MQHNNIFAAYSMTSSATASGDGGTVRPSILAVEWFTSPHRARWERQSIR
jgi:hypothetical protein